MLAFTTPLDSPKCHCADEVLVGANDCHGAPPTVSELDSDSRHPKHCFSERVYSGNGDENGRTRSECLLVPDLVP